MIERRVLSFNSVVSGLQIEYNTDIIGFERKRSA